MFRKEEINMKFKDNIAWMVEEQESLLVNHELNQGVVLSETGNEIIKLFVQGLSENQIIESLCKKYNKSDSIQIKQDVVCFFNQLVDNGFIERELK